LPLLLLLLWLWLWLLLSPHTRHDILVKTRVLYLLQLLLQLVCLCGWKSLHWDHFW
jgi:hypothetical protein